MLFRARSAAVLIASALVVTACSGSETDAPDPSPTSSASGSASADPEATPTPGTQVSKDPFALTLPEGWTEVDPSGALLLALSDQVTDDFATNVNVIQDSTIAATTPEELETHLTEIVTGPQSSDIEPRGTFEIDGDDGARISQTLDIGGLKVKADRIAVVHGDSGYLVTFSFAASTSAADRDDVVEAVMATWTWAS